MSIRVKSVSFEDYQNTQVTAKCANFLQSAEMAKLQESQDYIERWLKGRSSNSCL